MQWPSFASHIGHFTSHEQQHIRHAYDLGQKAHAGQMRLSGKPYFTHPIAVATSLIQLGADADTIMAALLHDTVEDTLLTLDEIEHQFNHTVRHLVEGVTKLSKVDIGDRPSLDEQIETLRKIFNLMQEDVRIIVIKLADRLHNMETIECLSPEKRLALAQETEDVYVKMASRLSMTNLAQTLEAFCIATLEPNLFSRLLQLSEKTERRGMKIIHTMNRGMERSHMAVARRITITYEHKRWDRIRQQLETEGTAATGISDLTVAFICPDIDTCYRVLGTLHQLWKQETLSFQDFINAPQINGYRGLHTTVILSDGTRVRCKIRTEEMHAYAHRGITLFCFDHTSKGFPTWLPWVQRIAPLSADTVDRSADFWQSLQSDILGESMVIHGPGDETVHLPAGASALDGAFYLFKDAALRSICIKVNGRDVPFQTPLKHGDALTATVGEEEAVQREWLTWSHTGLATAKIHSALAAGKSEVDKFATGKAMLQRVFTERRKGFIEEFDEATLSQRLSTIGMLSLDEAYASIADGRTDPENIFEEMFGDGTKGAEPRSWTIRYHVDMNSLTMMDAVDTIHRSIAPSLQDVHYHRASAGDMGQVTVRARLSPREKDRMTASLRMHGITDARATAGYFPFHIPGIILMLFLWGLDPVMSKLLLEQGVHPMSFTLIRTVSISLFSLCTLQWIRQKGRLSAISITSPSLWLAGTAFFLVSLFTYAAVARGTPILYNAVLRSNAFLVSAPDMVLHGNIVAFLSSTAVTLTGFLFLHASDIPKDALLLSLLVLGSFSIYTIASNHFQSSARVLARLPQFFAFTSAVAAGGAVIAFLLFPSPFPTATMTAIIAAYCIGFVGTPYILFYKFRREIGYAAISPWNHLLVIVTFIGQWLIFGIDNVWTLVAAAVLLATGSLIASRSIQSSGPSSHSP